MTGEAQTDVAPRRVRLRLRLGTWIWLLLGLSFLLFLNLAGQRGPTIWDVGEMRHGWPFPIVLREVGWTDASPWRVASEVAEFSPWAMLGDLAVAGLLLWVIARWSERRARSRALQAITWRRWFPWRLASLLVVIVVLVAGWSIEQWRLQQIDAWEAAAWSRIASHWDLEQCLVVLLPALAVTICLAGSRGRSCGAVAPQSKHRSRGIGILPVRKLFTGSTGRTPIPRSIWNWLLLALTLAIVCYAWALWRSQASRQPSLSMLCDLAALAVLFPLAAAGWRLWQAWRVRCGKPPRLQFSLRSLLALTLVCAIGLGYGVDYYLVELSRDWRLRRGFEYSLVPHALRPVARVTSHWSGQKWHRWNRAWWGLFDAIPPETDEQVQLLRYMIRSYPQQTSLCLKEDLTAAQVERLEGASRVHSAIVEVASERNVSLLDRLPEIRHLFLMQSEARVTNRTQPYDFLSHVRQMAALRKLYVFGERIDDDELAHLQGLSDLEDLHLNWRPHTFWLWGTTVDTPTPENVYAVADGRRLSTIEARISDRGLAHLAGLKNLVRLRLEGTQITGHGLTSLHHLPRLRHLSLEGAPMTNAGLSYVNGCRHLVSLDLSYTRLSTLDALAWEQLPHLRRLDISGTDVSEQLLDELRRQHPRVTILHSFYDEVQAAEQFGARKWLFNAGQHVNEEMLRRVSQIATIRHLSLSCSDIADDDLRHFSGMTHLETITFNRTRVGNAGLEHLWNLTQLRDLSLTGTLVTDVTALEGWTDLRELNLDDSQVTSEGLTALRQFAVLNRLSLRNTPVTDTGLAHLAGLTQLSQLELEGTRVTDAGLVHLAGLTQLSRLFLHRTQVDGSGLAQLAGLAQLEELSLDSLIVDNHAAAQLQTWPRLPGTIYLHHPQRDVAKSAALKLKLALPQTTIHDVSWDWP